MKFRLIYILIFLLGDISQAAGATLNLTLVMSEKSGAYLDFINAVNKRLVGQDVAVRVLDLGMQLPSSDLVVAVGMKAAATALQSCKAPVLVVFAPKEGYASLLTEQEAGMKDGGCMHSAIFLDQPVQRQFEFIRALFPRLRSVGILYSAMPKDISMMRAQAKMKSLELVEQAVPSQSALPSALKEVLVGSDVLLALPDPEIYNSSTIRNILLATYRNRVPLLGFSASYVKAGALAAIYTSPEQVADQTVSMVQGFMSIRMLPAARYSREFEISVNEQVARSLGLNIRSEAQLRQEIGKSQ